MGTCFMFNPDAHKKLLMDQTGNFEIFLPNILYLMEVYEMGPNCL